MTYSTKHQPRADGFDHWRAVMCLYGIIVHYCCTDREASTYVLCILSTMFRMETFFLFAGFVMAGSMMRAGDIDLWMAKRMRSLFYPFCFGILVLCPINLVCEYFAYGRIDATIEVFWFIGVLGIYTLVLGYGHRQDLIDPAIGWIDRIVQKYDMQQASLLAAVTTIAVLCYSVEFGAGKAIYHLYKLADMSQNDAAAGVASWWSLIVAITYGPFVATGFLLARSNEVRGRLLTGIRLPAVIFAVIFAVAIIVWNDDSLGTQSAPIIVKVLRTELKPIGAASSAVILIQLALRRRSVHPLIRRISDASFTVYGCHCLMIHLMVMAWPALIAQTPLQSALVLTVVTTATLAFHFLVVERFALAALLMNGRPIPGTALSYGRPIMTISYILCFFGIHHRSARHAKRMNQTGGFETHCNRCHGAMIKKHRARFWQSRSAPSTEYLFRVNMACHSDEGILWMEISKYASIPWLAETWANHKARQMIIADQIATTIAARERAEEESLRLAA
ncbi:MAG: acyltransferase [Oxalobacteraceae bacterium]|nr:MAG: acyltransferase [Oxalobacteraceae bacterium]